MKESDSFYCPEDAVYISNAILRELVVGDIEAKSAKPTFIVGDKEITFPITTYSQGQLGAYRQALIAFALDPENASDTNYGHGYALMLTEILKKMYRYYPEFIVIQSPAALDFTGNHEYKEWGPSADIIIGKPIEQQKKNLIAPVLILSAVKGYKSTQDKLHPKLQVPLICIPGESIFGNGITVDRAIYSFATSGNPRVYADLQARNSGPLIASHLAKQLNVLGLPNPLPY